MYYVYINKFEVIKTKEELIRRVNEHYNKQFTSLNQVSYFRMNLHSNDTFVYETSLRRFMGLFWGDIGRLIAYQSGSRVELEQRLNAIFDFHHKNNKKIPWAEFFGMKFVAYKNLSDKLEDRLNSRKD